MRPDPAGLVAAKPANPQSWNRYTYVLDNVMVYVDGLGLAPCDTVENRKPYSPDQQQDAKVGGGPFGPDADPQWPTISHADRCGNIGGEGGSDGYFMDGAYVPWDLGGGFSGAGLFGSGESSVQCPNNVCSGFGTDANGDVKFVQFEAFAGGVSGYYNPQDLVDGVYDYGGQIYNAANYQSLLEQVYAPQISSQCATVSGNLSADTPADSGAHVASCSDKYIQGGHANFSVDCGSWNGGDCAGRWPGGLHIEGNQAIGFWGHNDTASFYLGGSFNWNTFNPWNLFVHTVVDVIGGNTAVYVFPH